MSSSLASHALDSMAASATGQMRCVSSTTEIWPRSTATWCWRASMSSYIPAWREGAVLSSLDAIQRLPKTSSLLIAHACNRELHHAHIAPSLLRFRPGLGLSGAVLGLITEHESPGCENLQTLRSAAVLSISPADTRR